MKILVLGALGCLGRFLTRELAQRGHHVTASDVRDDHAEAFVKCDIRHYRELGQLFDAVEPECVYNLAAEFGRANGEDHYENLWATNVVGLKNILTHQRSGGFRLVHMSSSEVYGDFDGVMHEDVPRQFGIRLLNDYAISKWANEQQIMNARERHGNEVVRIRPFNVYGPGESYSRYRSVIARFVYHALHDLPYAVHLGHTRTSTYVTDMVSTLANVADRFHPGEVYNVAGDETHDIKTCSDLILACLGKTDALVEYRSADPFTTLNKRPDTSKAARDLGHRPRVSLDEGIRKTVEWFGRYSTGPTRPEFGAWV